jgi:hypothetical protein
MAWHLFLLKGWRDCLTGHFLGSTWSLCSASSIGTPGMSVGLHAKMPRFSWRYSLSALSYEGVRSPPIMTCWLESPGTSLMLRVCMDTLKVGCAELIIIGFFRIWPGIRDKPSQLGSTR